MHLSESYYETIQQVFYTKQDQLQQDNFKKHLETEPIHLGAKKLIITLANDRAINTKEQCYDCD